VTPPWDGEASCQGGIHIIRSSPTPVEQAAEQFAHHLYDSPDHIEARVIPDLALEFNRTLGSAAPSLRVLSDVGCKDKKGCHYFGMRLTAAFPEVIETR
jgi:hypothetical protein